MANTPRNFDIDPTGEWMVGYDDGSNNAQIFRIDKKTGNADAGGRAGQRAVSLQSAVRCGGEVRTVRRGCRRR